MLLCQRPREQHLSKKKCGTSENQERLVPFLYSRVCLIEHGQVKKRVNFFKKMKKKLTSDKMGFTFCKM